MNTIEKKMALLVANYALDKANSLRNGMGMNRSTICSDIPQYFNSFMDCKKKREYVNTIIRRHNNQTDLFDVMYVQDGMLVLNNHI